MFGYRRGNDVIAKYLRGAIYPTYHLREDFSSAELDSKLLPRLRLRVRILAQRFFCVWLGGGLSARLMGCAVASEASSCTGR